MMGEKVDANAVDRISELPAFIIHDIMSFLPPKEVAKTSLISKTWNHLQASFPILDFDQTDFVGFSFNPQNLTKSRKKKELQEGLRKFMKFVDVSMLRFCQLNFSILKFRLFLSLFNVKESSPMVDKWIELALEKKVKELDVKIVTDGYSNAVYTLPLKIFSAESLTTLKLSCCKILELPSDTITLYSLKKLRLEKVYINEQMLQKLTSQCSFLEYLSLSSCRGVKHLCFSEALKLEIFEICGSDELVSVEIAAPSLQQFKLAGAMSEHRPFAIDMVGCPNLKRLKLLFAKFEDQEFHRLVSQFPLLEDLYMLHCDLLRRIMISSHWLKSLEIEGCDNLKEIQIDTPNLLSFWYRCYSLPPTGSINAPCPLKLDFTPSGDIDTRWLLNLKEFLGVSNKIKVLTISVCSGKISFNLDELRESCTSFPCQVENLGLSVESSQCIELLNSLLWICYPRTVCVEAFEEVSEKLLEPLYERLRDRDGSSCDASHIKCWQHHLKGVKTEADEEGGIILIHFDWCFEKT